MERAQHAAGDTRPSGACGAGTTSNVVVGMGLILLGLVLVLERAGVVDGATLIRFWPLLLVLIGAGLVVQALWGGHTDGTSDRSQGPGGAWVVLVLIALVSWHVQRRGDDTVTDTDATRVHVVGIMGRGLVTSHATGLRRADVTTLMGRSQLDLRQATPEPGADVVVDVFGLMGAAIVNVPPHWTIDVRTVPVLGRVRDARNEPSGAPDDPAAAEAEAAAEQVRRRVRGRQPRDEDRPGVLRGATILAPLEAPAEGDPAPRLVLRGFFMMGELTIRS